MKSFAGLSILLVEDEYLIAIDAEQILKDLGVKSVEIAATFESASDQARRGRFDAAVLDVNLNGQQSFPIAAVLAQRGVPVVFASGYDLRERIPTGLDGVALTKPYTSERLKEALSAALSKSVDT